MFIQRASWALPIALALALAGCGGGSNASNVPKPKPTPTAGATTGATTTGGTTAGATTGGTMALAPMPSELSGRIVYAQSFRPDDDPTGRSSLYVADADGTDARRLTPPELNTNNGGGRVSRDGSRVTFGTFDRDSDTFPVYMVNLDGSGLQRADANFRAGALSPDGQTVAYSVFFDGEADGNRRNEIFLAPADGSGTPRLFAGVGRSNDTPSFSPDGRSLLFAASDVPGTAAGSSGIYLAPADGSGGARLLVASDDKVLRSPAFAPDGSSFCYLSLDNNSGDIFTARADGSNRRVVAVGDQITAFSYSPDGRYLAYQEGFNRGAVAAPDRAVVNIYITRADGSSESRLFQPTAGRGSQYGPTWIR